MSAFLFGLIFTLLPSTPQFMSEQAPDSMQAIRVMSFNIRLATTADGINYWPNRSHRVFDLIRYHDPVVVGLQEVLHRQLEDIDSALTNMSWIGVGREDGRREGEYSPIFYRKDLLEVEDEGVFWLSESPADTGSVGWDAALPRIATWARFRDIDSGDRFVFYNTHFDHRGRLAREASARLIMRRIRELQEGLPIVLVGDFNASPFSTVYPTITEATYTGQLALRDARQISASPPDGPEGTCCGFDALAADDERQIDYIFTSPGVQCMYFATLTDQWEGRYPSDHRPVIADLVLPAAETN